MPDREKKVLFPHRATAFLHNKKKLAELPGETKRYTSVDHGNEVHLSKIDIEKVL